MKSAEEGARLPTASAANDTGKGAASKIMVTAFPLSNWFAGMNTEGCTASYHPEASGRLSDIMKGAPGVDVAMPTST